MRKKSRTEITIETDRTLLIRARKSLTEVWCEECREPGCMAPIEEIVALSGMSARAIYRAVKEGEVHFIETGEGLLFICLKSLAVAKNDNTLEVIKVNSPASVPFVELASRTSEQQVQDRFVCAGQQPSTDGRVTAAPREAEPPACKREWVLTEGALDRLLKCLDADRDCAGQKYENIRQKLIRYFECRACLFPEEKADETINRVARRISEGKEIWTTDPAKYFYGVARNVLREYLSAPERRFAPIGWLQSASHPYEDSLKLEGLEYDRWLMEKRLELLEECIQELSRENREMIINYYKGEKGTKIKNRRELADYLGIQPDALRARVHRTREKLEKLVRDRLDQMIPAQNVFDSGR